MPVGFLEERYIFQQYQFVGGYGSDELMNVLE
jgi:hypothetical protein